NREPEIFRHLAMALAAQKYHTAEAQQIYAWTLEKFPQDKALCLQIAEALLQNDVTDDAAERCYMAALAHHPPFAKNLYLQLHRLFYRRGQFREAFQALKQALFLGKSGDDELVTRLVDLGWRHQQMEELIVTLRFLLGHDEANATIRRALAFSLAHALILQQRDSLAFDARVLQDKIDLPLIQEFLHPPDSLSTLQMVRDDCTLRLALLLHNEQTRLVSQAEPQTPGLLPGAYPAAFEYQFLLDNSPLEEVLAHSASRRARGHEEIIPLLEPLAAFNWEKDFLESLPCFGNALHPEPTASALSQKKTSVKKQTPVDWTNDDANPLTRAESQLTGRALSLLVMAPIFIDKNSNGSADHAETTASTPFPKDKKKKITPDHAAPTTTRRLFLDLAGKHLRTACSQARVYILSDGLLAFAAEPHLLATAALEVFRKVARYYTVVPDNDHIALRAALLVSETETEANNLAGLELLYHALHLILADTLPLTSGRSCLLMNRSTFDAIHGQDFLPAKFLGRVYLETPALKDELYEAIWHNPLDYANERQPYSLGRFLVAEKFLKRRTYGTYRGRDRLLERPVILKALDPEIYSQLRSDPVLHEAIVEAIRRIGRLEHPGVPLIYDMGRHEDIFFFAREYIEGESLASWLVSKKSGNGTSAAPAEALRLILEVCRILQHAHQHQVYHHNLKPSNIWIQPSPSFAEEVNTGVPQKPIPLGYNVKISDFSIPGFSEPGEVVDQLNFGFTSKTQNGHFGASGYYMAPERIYGKRQATPQTEAANWQAAADIFSLGMILYECLCGEHPYSQISNFSLPHASPIPPPSARMPEGVVLPAACDAVVLRAIQKDPRARFQSIAEFETAIMEILQQSGGKSSGG
ncbi:MAG: protein kinase, partial [candidate division KSB1 bacterium]|nr:protein kinase [candidate division KSB1 bacterium]